MRKNFTLKLFITLLLSSTFLILIFNCDVKATNFEETELTLEKLEEKLEEEDEIICYDATTNETTKVDMEEIRQVLKLQKNIQSNTTSSYIPLTDRYPAKPEIMPYSSGSSMDRITNTFVSPYKQICRLEFNASNGSNKTYHGTGTLIGKNILLTCSHCVFDQENNNQKYLNWTAYPGYNGNQYLQGKSGWKRVYSSGKWMENHSYEYDWAICILESDLGTNLGWLGLQSYGQNSHMFNVPVKVVGYPGDTTYGFNGNAIYQYESGDKILTAFDRYFHYSGWTVGGFSGGPIRRSDNLIVGVHFGISNLGGEPIGVKITQDMIDLVNNLHSQS